VRVALAQVDCVLGDVAENARRAREAIGRAREQGADLVVFPELNLTGYAIDDDVAMAADDPVIMELGAQAGEMAIVLGFVEEGPIHRYNSAIYLEAGRAAHVHRKTYLPTFGVFEERKRFSPGQGVRAFDTALGRFAVLICFDFWQAPLPFIAVHDGARALILPTCSPVPAGGVAEIRRDWDDLLRVHARFLQTYLIYVNRVGEEAGATFWGGSRVVDPWGETVAEAPADEPALIVADIELAAVRRRRHEVPLLKEARLGLLSRELERLAGAGGDV
jgi:predicted amidohydrolase